MSKNKYFLCLSVEYINSVYSKEKKNMERFKMSWNCNREYILFLVRFEWCISFYYLDFKSR